MSLIDGLIPQTATSWLRFRIPGWREVKKVPAVPALSTLTRGKFYPLPYRRIFSDFQSAQGVAGKTLSRTSAEDLGGFRLVLFIQDSRGPRERTLKVKLTEPPVMPRMILGNHIRLISPRMSQRRSTTAHLCRRKEAQEERLKLGKSCYATRYKIAKKKKTPTETARDLFPKGAARTQLFLLTSYQS